MTDKQADAGADNLPPLPAPKYPQMKVLAYGEVSDVCGYTAEQVRQAQREAVAADRRRFAEQVRKLNELCAQQTERIAALGRAIATSEAELAALHAEVREWLCIDCKAVYPGPPQAGTMCVMCPKCQGSCGPRGFMERRALQKENADLRAELASRGAVQGRNTGEELSSDLHKALTAARQYIEARSTEQGYGFHRPANPHDFHPDAESCSDEEIAAHKAACEAYDKGECTPERGSEWVSAMHILCAPWGIGSYTYRDPEADSVIAMLDKALGAAQALDMGVEVKVERGRVWIVRGNQSFMLAYVPDEGDDPAEIQAYADNLRSALSIITLCVKSENSALDMGNRPASIGDDPDFHLFLAEYSGAGSVAERDISPATVAAMEAKYKQLIAHIDAWAARRAVPDAKPIAWARKWHVDGEKPEKAKNSAGRWAWPQKFKFHATTPHKIFPDDVPLIAAAPVTGDAK